MIPRTGEVLLLQMDGHLTVTEFNKAMEYAVPALEQIYQMQKDALRRRYASTETAEESADDQTAESSQEA
jgi:exosome complex component RRP41